MNTSTHAFVTVDMRGLKAALVARAQAERVSVSVLVRRAVERDLRHADGSSQSEGATRVAAPTGPVVKLSIRLASGEAAQLDASARRAGLSRGAFLVGLLADVPSLSGGAGSRPDCIAALTASSAELSTLSRSIDHLVALLRKADVETARKYRQILDTLEGDVRKHLSLAASVLAALQPAHVGGSSSLRHRRHAQQQGDRHVPTTDH